LLIIIEDYVIEVDFTANRDNFNVVSNFTLLECLDNIVDGQGGWNNANQK